MRRRHFLGLGALGLTTALAGCGTPKGAAYVDGRLSMAVISTYGTGTATYADMAAVANAMTGATGIRTRIMTSDTGIGRLTPLRRGLATFARSGDEYIYARYARYEFAGRDWGPQRTRMVWLPRVPHSLLVRADSGIETYDDLRGKKIPLITANYSVNTKIGVTLAAAGLTEDDVTMVPISYGEQAAGLKAGKIDILYQQVYGSSLYELESSTPVRWLKMQAGDPKLLAAIAERSPSLLLGPFTGAPGQEEGQEDIGYQYALPIVTYESTDEETVRTFITAIIDSYDGYKDATRTAPNWAPDKAILAPQEVPFHAALVQVLSERGLWTPQAQEKQDRLLAEEPILDRGWAEVTAATTNDDELARTWAAWKDQNLD